MDNYYKRPSPQEQRYRDVLEAIRSLSPMAEDLARELDDAVWQMVGRAVDVALADHDGKVLVKITESRVQRAENRGPSLTDLGVSEEEAEIILGRLSSR